MDNIPWWSRGQLATKYGVTRQTIYAWERDGLLPAPSQHPVQGIYWMEHDLPLHPTRKVHEPVCGCDPMDGTSFECICP
jgi:hypothetical protein